PSTFRREMVSTPGDHHGLLSKFAGLPSTTNLPHSGITTSSEGEKSPLPAIRDASESTRSTWPERFGSSLEPSEYPNTNTCSSTIGPGTGLPSGSVTSGPGLHLVTGTVNGNTLMTTAITVR